MGDKKEIACTNCTWNLRCLVDNIADAYSACPVCGGLKLNENNTVVNQKDYDSRASFLDNSFLDACPAIAKLIHESKRRYQLRCTYCKHMEIDYLSRYPEAISSYSVPRAVNKIVSVLSRKEFV